MSLQLPSIVLIVIAGLSLTWIVTFHRLRPGAPAQAVLPDSDPPKLPHWRLLRSRAAEWIGHNRTELALATFAALLGLGIVLSAPAVARDSTRAPLFGLHYVRSFQLDYATASAPLLAVAGGAVSLGLLLHAHRSRSFVAARTGLLVAGLGLASLGQLAVLGFYDDPAGVLYGLAIAFFAAWAWAWSGHVEPDLIGRVRPSWREIALLGIVLGLTMLARFHKLGSIPYGIEGDESRWTVEVVHAMVDGRRPFGTEYHLASVPVSFYMQSMFHRIFGPGIHSARLGVATFSVLSSLVFYWAARQLTGPAVAALSTFLLGISIFDISASRLANVESHVKLWPVLALALLAYASRERRSSTFLLAGMAVALGMLTYDTVWPLVGAAGLILLIDLVRQRTELRQSVSRFTLYLIPQLLAFPITLAYVSGRLQYYGVDRRWSGDPIGTVLVHLSDLLDSLFRSTHGDFLYNRFGPLFNSLLLPWLVLGAVAVLYHWRRQRLLWVVIFAGLFFVPAPILTNAPAGRVLYPGLPAAYLVIAVGMWAAFQEFTRVLGKPWKPLLFGAGAIGLSYLAALNLYIYFNEVRDFADRELRRELYEIARSTSRADSLTVYPYVPELGDPIEHEADYAIWLGYRSRASNGSKPLPYTAIPLDQFERKLAGIADDYQHLEVVWPANFPDEPAERASAMRWLVECFAEPARLSGRHYDRYLLTQALKISSDCKAAGG